jgi:hypothetical protein
MNEKIELEVLTAEYDGNVLELVLAPEDMTEAYTLALFNADFDRDKKAFVPNEETSEKFNATVKEYLGFEELGEDELTELVGRKLELFKNEDKVTFWEVQKLLRPLPDMFSFTYFAEIVDIQDYDAQRRVIVELYEEDEEGKKSDKLEGRYFVNFGFGQWIPSKQINLPVESKKIKKQKEFQDKLLVNWDNAKDLIGVVVKVEAKENPMTDSDEGYLELKKRKAPKK